MIRLVHANEVNKISNMPQEIKNIVTNVLVILDDAYDATRSINDMGGYVAIIEKKEELEKFNEVEEKNIDDTIISMFQWSKSNIKSDIKLNEVIEWCDEIDRYGYTLIYENHLIYKKTANLDDFAKENLENMLEMDYYVDKLLTKDDLIEYWMNDVSKDSVISELISGVDIDELLDMNQILIIEDKYGEEYMYSEVDI